MKKYTKIGLSALCGSLASISAANAGSIDVTGSALATWTQLGGQVTGNPLGIATGLTFTGNGELDGGQTFTVAIAHTNKNAYSSAGITLNTNSAGKFKLSSAEGGQGIGGYDDNMPRAYEEVWDTAIATNANFQKGVASTTNISWTSPKFVGTTLQIAYAPDNDGSSNVKKGVSGSKSDAFGSGWDIVLDTGTANGGINMFAGISETEQTDEVRANLQNLGGKHQEAVVGLQFKMGPIAIGGQVSAERLRTQSKASTNYYGNTSFGVAFNVNDALSISYSRARHVQTKLKKQGHLDSLSTVLGDNQNTNINEYTPKSWMRGDSYQVAYTIGGIGLKYARTDYDNTAYTFDAKVPRESQIVAISLAF